jgi:hypothetical protein
VRLDSLFRFLFVVYCLEAGLFLLISPWTDAWERLAMLLPGGLLRTALAAPWMRGLFSGFGAAHLVWAAHDVDLVFRRGPAHATDGAPLTGRQ